MSKKILPFLLLAFGTSLHATINFTITTGYFDLTATPPVGNYGFASVDGTPLGADNRVLMGGFDFGGVSAEQFLFNFSQQSELSLASYVFEAFTPISNFSFDAPSDLEIDLVDGGMIASGTVLNFEPTDLGLGASDAVWLLVFRTKDDTGNLGLNFENVVEIGAFSSVNTGWNFTDGTEALARLVSLETKQITDALLGSVGGNALFLESAIGVVPEPSAFAAFAGLFVAAMALRRRRR